MRTQIPPKHIQAPLISMKTTQIPPDTPRYPTETPQTFDRHTPDISREHDMQTAHNKCQQTPPDILKQHRSMSWGVWRCLLTSVDVCWHVLFPGETLGVSGECVGGVGRYRSGSHENRRRWDVFGGYFSSQFLQYGAKTLFWHSPERHDLFSSDYSETLKYQNVYI